MYKLKLIRLSSSEQGTKGLLLINDGFFCYTLELPWDDNKPNYSCIPPGIYKLERHLFRGRRKCYHLLDVPDRKWVLIHNGNLAGDTRKGYKTNVEGCILVGKYFGKLYGQNAVLSSTPTLRKLIEVTQWKAEEINILDSTGYEKYGDWYANKPNKSDS